MTSVMKFRVFLSLVLLTFFCYQLTFAQTVKAELPTHSMKGYELYSWKTGGQWNFALLVGTNRFKTRKEITSPKVRLKGVEALKEELERLEKGEWITWSSKPKLQIVLPSETIVEEVKDYCNLRGLLMTVTTKK